MMEEERIDRYLRGDMSTEENHRFEEELNLQPDLREALELQEEAQRLVHLAGSAEKRKEIARLFTEAGDGRVKARRTFTWLAIAASVMLVAVIGTLVFQPHADSQELYAAYFEPYRAPVNVRSGAEEASTAWQNASDNYSNGNYVQAISEFKQIIESGSENGYLAHFYLGMSILATGNSPLDAIPHFEAVQYSANDYQQQAQWYKALAYMKAGEVDKAREELTKISQKNQYKSAEARELLDKLN